MKKSLLALAVLSAFAGVASAQSSVTLSGNVDLGIVRTGGQWTMGGAASGRNNVTLRGVEDLGGGMNVGFYLNHRFNLETGNINSSNSGSGTPFWRQGWIQIGGGFGDVRLGKMLPPVQEFNGGYEPWKGGDTVGNVHTGGKYAGANNARYSKAIYYRTPSLGGLQGHAMVAAAESQGTVQSSEKPVGLGVQYAAGPFSAALAYDKNQNDLKTVGVYGKYNFGFATLMGQFEKQDESSAVFPLSASAFGKDSSKRWSIGASAPMGAAVAKIGYTKWKDEKISKFGLGLDYSLSKRTYLYADLGKLSGDAPSDDAKKTMFDVGISHGF
jgi:predicted porin